jgi:hypothetical protein
LDVDTDEYVGHQFSVMVEPSSTGDSTRIGSFVRTDLPDMPF